MERCYLFFALITINSQNGKTFFRFIKTFERMVLFYGRQLNKHCERNCRKKHFYF